MKKVLSLVMALVMIGCFVSCSTSAVEQKAINAVKRLKDSVRDPDSLKITGIRYKDLSNYDEDNDSKEYEDEYVLLIKANATNGFGGYVTLDTVVDRNNKILTSEDDDLTVAVINAVFMVWDELSNHELDAEKILKKANE